MCAQDLEQHEGQPQANKKNKKTTLLTLLVCCLNMEGILVKIFKAFVSFSTLTNTELSWILLIRATGATHLHTRTHTHTHHGKRLLVFT